MNQVIFLCNEYAGILDLSAITDVNGQKVVLQPKGYKGSERECYASVETHPHVLTFQKCGRLSIRRGSAATAAIEPALPPAASKATKKVEEELKPVDPPRVFIPPAPAESVPEEAAPPAPKRYRSSKAEPKTEDSESIKLSDEDVSKDE